MANKQPGIYDLQTLLQAGIDPKTGLPTRITESNASKGDIKRQLRIIDEQDAVNRYVWYNLPLDITGQELERMLYYKGQLAFFYMEQMDKFFVMPYALDGSIDFYGRFNTIHPVPMAEGTTNEEKERYRKQLDILSRLQLNCVYGLNIEPYSKDLVTKSAVLLHDYTKQLSQTIIPRQQVNDGLLDIMADCIPFMHTNLLGGCGTTGIRVNDADEQSNVMDANRSIVRAALNGERYIPMIGKVDFQELTSQVGTKAEEFMLAMQSLDNFRLSTYGLENGGVFEKKAHTLGAEQQMNASNTGLVYQDGLSIRQNFCNIVNSIWGLGIWCEPSENETMADINGDGVLYDENLDGASSGVDTDNGGESNA